MSESICLDRYASAGEAKAARALIDVLLERGLLVSVNDGGEWTVQRSSDRDKILAALATTGMDTIKVRPPHKMPVATFQLVYQDGPADELIADYGGKPIADEIWHEVQQRLGA
jgi:hypothetical protein